MVMTMTKHYARMFGSSVIEIITLPKEINLADVFTHDVAATLQPVPDTVTQGWRLIEGEWQPPEQPELPALDDVKDDLKQRIDTAAETERLKYITPGSGQAMTYQEKVAQAASYTKSWLAHTVDPDNAPEVNAAEYPLLAASLGIDGDTLLEVAETVTYAYALWQQIGAAIEATRLLAKIAIDDAADIEDAQSIFDALIWPTPQTLAAA